MFLERLGEKPGLARKIYNKIKQMYRMATAGSKEARQLEQLKNKFEKMFQAKSDSKAESDGKVSKKSDNLRYLLSAIEKATPSAQELERNIQTVANMDSVYTVDPSKLEDSGSDIKEIYEPYFMGVMLQRDNKHQRLYIHDVLI